MSHEDTAWFPDTSANCHVALQLPAAWFPPHVLVGWLTHLTPWDQNLSRVWWWEVAAISHQHSISPRPSFSKGGLGTLILMFGNSLLISLLSFRRVAPEDLPSYTLMMLMTLWMWVIASIWSSISSPALMIGSTIKCCLCWPILAVAMLQNIGTKVFVRHKS